MGRRPARQKDGEVLMGALVSLVKSTQIGKPTWRIV